VVHEGAHGHEIVISHPRILLGFRVRYSGRSASAGSTNTARRAGR
jgi:hypothetical protein